jgi:hypothetical protein
VEELEREAADVVEMFLRRNGWKQTCVGNPGAQWLWEREWEGRRWTYPSAKMAFTAHCEMFPDLEDEEDESDA